MRKYFSTNILCQNNQKRDEIIEIYETDQQELNNSKDEIIKRDIIQAVQKRWEYMLFHVEYFDNLNYLEVILEIEGTITDIYNNNKILVQKFVELANPQHIS